MGSVFQSFVLIFFTIKKMSFVYDINKTFKYLNQRSYE